jgi:hypothetical protein
MAERPPRSSYEPDVAAPERFAATHAALGVCLCDHRHRNRRGVRRHAPRRRRSGSSHVAVIMSPGVRRFALTVHVTCSVGWLGAVAGFLALALTGLNSQNGQLVRAAYLGMELTGWFVIVPLSFASLLTGLIQSLGTHWGLFRHYWVLIKLLMASFATALLLVHMRPISHVAGVAARTTLSTTDLHGLRVQLVADAGAAIAALLVTTTLSVYKPRGLTRYGWRKQKEEHSV